MTDPTALLSHAESPPAAARRQRRSLDDAIEHCIGNFSRTQLLQSIVLSSAWFFDAQQAFISIFTDAQPKWSCNDSSSSCNVSADICQLPKGSWSWNLPAHTSIVSEWSLQCSGSVITGLPASSFFLGCLVGGFVLATLADSSLGRKNLLILSCLLMSLAGILTAVSTSIWMYIGLRFVGGLGRAAIGTCALVLATELVGKKWRGNVGLIGFIWFTLGFLSLPVIAFLLKVSSWRLIYVWTCLPCFFYSSLVYFTVHESPRWLFIKGRKEEFLKTLRNMAPSENMTETLLVDIAEFADESADHNIYSALKILLKKRWAVERLLLVMAVAFGLGMTYIGMPFGLNNLSFNLYFSVALNALSELPATLLAFFLIGKVNRRGSVLGLALLSGICSLACVVVRWKRMQIALELVSFFSACAAVDAFLIYTLELFPTCVRNSAVSLVRQAIVVSGMLSPLLAAAGRRSGWFSYGVFGATTLACGLLVTWLPETRGRKFCDTMEEEELKNGEFVS